MSDDLHHLAAAYSLDALEADERRAFEAHYPTCEICTQEVVDFREVAGSLATSTASQPGAALKAQVMAEIAQTKQLAPRTTSRPSLSPWRSAPALLAAAAALVIVAALAGLTLRDSANDRVSEVVAAPDVTMTALPATGGEPGQLQVFWSAERDQVAVIASELDGVPSDQAYALWFVLDDGTVAPAALFQTNDGKFRDVLTVDDLDPVGWGISIEPGTGSPQPTTDVIFAGTL